MIAVQHASLSPSAFPRLLPTPSHPLMMSNPTSNQVAHTSVFSALGSYADRIKDNASKSAPQSGEPAISEPAAPSGATSSSSSPATTSTPTKSAAQQSRPSAPSKQPTSNDHEDDGAWETVQNTRHRARTEDKKQAGSDSRNWRERTTSKEQSVEDENRSKSGHKSAKETHPKGALLTVEKSPQPGTQPTATTSTSAIGSKSVWGSLGVQSGSSSRARTSTPPAQTQSQSTSSQNATTPSSPSLNGTTITNNSASPDLSAETSSTTTIPDSATIVDHSGLEGKVPAAESKQPVVPAVNPWEERKKKLGTAASPMNVASASKSSTLSGRILQFGSVSPPPTPNVKSLPNGHTEAIEGALAASRTEKRPTAGTSADTPAGINASLWPDVGQAAEVSRAAEEKKDKSKERKDSETSTAVEDPPAVGSGLE
ncbi:hypothetical protein BD324DRAFT_292682 [Kockovaella imperatae]|uniref:Uncharacterized protein n=1 Tax=Kockovaella imperatae TaxID=4999 RepID=A0A1Y1ULH2_9TREE|nr:hypothetical protein BD324DRAFT_292682 [Kockovaella imperatae]ORX38832.1 hypothetical protein BD324DRAFT_292682 [Kockovaella imperatae]